MLNYDEISKVCDRAEAMRASQTSRITLFMDIDNANKQFDLKPELLEADDQNFAHDIVGIQNGMDRSQGKVTNFFLPRYAESQEV